LEQFVIFQTQRAAAEVQGTRVRNQLLQRGPFERYGETAAQVGSNKSSCKPWALATMARLVKAHSVDSDWRWGAFSRKTQFDATPSITDDTNTGNSK
jgi:hypothetical protein